MSYYFDGASSQLFSASVAPVTASPLSVVAWVKTPDTANTRTIWGTNVSTAINNYFVLRINSSEIVEAITRDDPGSTVTATSSSALSANTWAMVYGTWNSGGAGRAAGINAANQGTESTTKSPAGTITKTFIGFRDTPTQYFEGYMALVALYNKVLSGSELTELLSAWPEDASSYGDCVAYWNMRDDEGTSIIPNEKNPGTYDLTLLGTTKPAYNSDNPTLQALSGAKRMLLLGTG